MSESLLSSTFGVLNNVMFNYIDVYCVVFFHCFPTKHNNLLNSLKSDAAGISLFTQNARFVFKSVNFHLIAFLLHRYLSNVIVSGWSHVHGEFMQPNSNEILHFAYFWDKSKLMTFKSICIKHQWHNLIWASSKKLWFWS